MTASHSSIEQDDEIPLPEDCTPHGLSSWVDEDGEFCNRCGGAVEDSE